MAWTTGLEHKSSGVISGLLVIRPSDAYARLAVLS
jgi:hypothetical protein